MVNSVTFKHEPYGDQHPYIPLPFERSPRDPASGDPVEVNVLINRESAAQKVWCFYTIDGVETAQRVEAQFVAQHDDQDQWRCTLPSFSGGETIHYRFFADSKGSVFSSDDFVFTVLSWISIESVAGITEGKDSVNVTFATSQKELYVNLSIKPQDSETFAFQLTANHDSPRQTKISEPFTWNWKGLQLHLNNAPFSFQMIRLSDGMKLQNHQNFKVLVDKDGRVLQYQLSFVSPSDEGFYGFGERFNALDQRGNQFDNYVYGQYTSQGKRTYIPVPFFVSSRCYGMWLKTDRQVEFDMAASSADQWSITGRAEEDSSFEWLCFFHNKPYEIVRAFTDKTGKSKLPPTWTFGLWMSSNDWNNQALVLDQMRETQKQDIPSSVLVIEAWSDEINFYIWNDARYTIKPSSEPNKLSDFDFPADGRWPDPKHMIDELHQNGLRVVLWQNPTIKFGDLNEPYDLTLNEADQKYAIEQGYVVKKADGSPHRIEMHGAWFRNSLVLDFTNPKAADWWWQKREYLVSEMGVDGFKTDGGEHVWDVKTRFSNGMRGSRGINHYPVAYEAAYDRFMEKLRQRDFVLFSRAGYTGVQQSPCHWAGDENSTWEAFRATLQALLNVGISGLPFVGWDIAGFAGPIPTSELYLRATAFSVFCPIMQYHSDVNRLERTSRDRTPWNMQKQTGDEQIIPVFRKFANLRMNLLPYLLSQALLSVKSGLPLMRVMSLVHLKDQKCRQFPTQYYFGEDLLVAPVVNEGQTELNIYLPQGEWRDFWTGEVIQGPVDMTIPVPFDSIPVYQKMNSVLPLNLDECGRLCSPVGNDTNEYNVLTLRVFADKGVESGIVFEPNSEASTVKVERNTEQTMTVIDLPEYRKELILIVNGSEPKSVTINEKPLSRLAAGHPTTLTGWYWDSTKNEICIQLSNMIKPSKLVIS